MQSVLSYIPALTILAIGFGVGCSNSATENSASSTQTMGAEGIVTRDADGKEWVTPDAEDAQERAAESGAEDVDDIGMAAPINIPGMNEIQ